MKHTTGEWKRRPGTSVITTGKKDICIVVAKIVGGEIVGKEDEANARLIAAAPTMLEKLRELVAEVKEYDLNLCDHAAGICNCSMRILVKQCEETIKAAEVQ